MNDKKYIQLFREKYTDKVYDDIEKSSGLIGTRVQLKDKEEYIGIIKCLWLPLLTDVDYRKKHLWYVEWDNGGKGIVEESQVKIGSELRP